MSNSEVSQSNKDAQPSDPDFGYWLLAQAIIAQVEDELADEARERQEAKHV